MNWRFVNFDPIYDRTKFDCGIPVLNSYLAQQMSQDVARKANVPILALAPGGGPVPTTQDQIVGFYTLSMDSVEFKSFPAHLKKKIAPYPVPAARIGRLAVDVSTQGKRLGETLLFHAIDRVEQELAPKIGVRAITVDAKNGTAAAFYKKYGFLEFPNQTGPRISMFLIV
jgi:ribosomal protein S18 acetylase RimI-like enzyme